MQANTALGVRADKDANMGPEDGASELSLKPSSLSTTRQRVRSGAVPPQFLPMLLALTTGPANTAAVAEGDQSNGRALSLDSTSHARRLASCGQTVTGSTVGASNRLGNLAPDHLHYFCTSVKGLHTFNSCGSSFDTWLRVWTQDLSRELLGCDDCGSCSTQTILTGELDVGCYKLVIDGYSTNSGTYTVGITCP